MSSEMNPNISDFRLQKTQQIRSLESIKAAQKKGSTTKDTIAKSEVEAAMLYLMYQAGVPLLPPPAINASLHLGSHGIDYDTIASMVNSAQDEICISMLNQWNKSLQEESERRREELNSPRYLAWQEMNSASYIANVETQASLKGKATDFHSFLNSLTPVDRLEEIQSNQNYTLRVGLANGLENYQQSVNSGDAGDVPFVAACFVIGASFIGDFTPILNTVSTGQLVINPQITFVKDTISQFQMMIPSDCRAELGLIGALFMTGAINYAETANVVSAAKGAKHDDKTLAKNYAEKIIELARSNVLDGFIGGMLVDKMEGSEKMSSERKSQLISIFKIIVLATAIGALYTADTKWITGKEFADLLKGDLKVDPDSQLSILAQLINLELSKLPDDESLQMKAALFAYMDTHPSYKNFFDVKYAFEGVAQTLPIKAGNLEDWQITDSV